MLVFLKRQCDRTLGTPQLLELIDADQIPVEYGGTSRFEVPGRRPYPGYVMQHVVYHPAPGLLEEEAGALAAAAEQLAEPAPEPAGGLALPAGEGGAFVVKAGATRAVPTACARAGARFEWRLA